MAQELRAVEAASERYDLAEGVLFDDRAGLVRFVDIREGRVLSARLDGDRLVDTTEVRVRETVGAVALADDGGLLVAAARRLATISPEGDLAFGPELLTAERPMRFNDGSVDPQGRFVVGTLSLSGPVALEELLRISPDGFVETLRDGIQLSNGVGWSPDGATIYHVDTMTKGLSSHSYGPGGFDTDEPWVPIPAEFPGFPDGLRVDAEGMLWVAQFSAGCVVRYAPDGRELARILVDAQQPTCVGFVGERLVITSAIEHLTPENRVPADGALFLVDVGVAGLPANRWSGSTLSTKETP
jgi:sugar lactone lactonase YvrE